MTVPHFRVGLVLFGLFALPTVAAAQSEQTPPVEIPPSANLPTKRPAAPASASGSASQLGMPTRADGAVSGRPIPGQGTIGVPGSANSK